MDHNTKIIVLLFFFNWVLHYLHCLSDFVCQKNNQVDALSNKAARKKEVEEKLEILNAKKHDLVQLLKQVSIYLLIVTERELWMLYLPHC